MTPIEEQVRSAVALQAGEWFVANGAGLLNDADRAAFVDWLKASPVHVEEYLGIALVARDLAVAASDPGIPLESLLAEARADQSDNVVALSEPIPVRDPPITRFWASRAWPLAASAGAAVIFLVASLVWWAHDGELLGLPKTYETAHGEQIAQRLPDGTWLHLNTDSAVTVRYSNNERVVDVDRGQVFFQVAHDSKRRLRVATGGAEVLAVGTQFEVYRKLNNTAVITVIEGTIGIEGTVHTRMMLGHELATGNTLGNPPAATGHADHLIHELRVSAGQRVRIEDGIVFAPPEPVNLQETVAWLHRKIAFEERPLGEVADEFSRYTQVRFEFDDPTLRALPVSGVFDAYDSDSFATFLATLNGVAVQRTATQIRVFRTLSKY